MAYINFQLRVRNSLETMKWILIETLKFWFFPHVKRIATKVSLNFHDAALKKSQTDVARFFTRENKSKDSICFGNQSKIMKP